MLARLRVKDLVVILGLILAVTLPFMDRAFHLDDNQFIKIAKNILQNPLQPFSGQIASGNTEELPDPMLEKVQKGTLTFESWVHPPLQPYFIALVAYLKGSLEERSQHLAYLVFTLLTALSAYVLARRFTPAPLWATLFLIVSPVFILSAHSLMSDMPMVAFYMAAVLAYIYGLDQDSLPGLIASGVLMALALLTRYAAITIVPVLVAYAVLHRARFHRAMLPFVVAGLIFGAWELENFFHYKRLHILAATSVAAGFDKYNPESANPVLVEKSIGFLVHMGSMLVFPVHALLAFLKRRRQIITYVIFVCLSVAGLLWNPGGIFSGYSKEQIALLLLFFTVGLFVTYHVIEIGLAPFLARKAETIYQNADPIFLSVWFGAVLVGSVLGFPFGTARYLFPLAFPLIIIVINKGRDIAHTEKRSWLFFASGVVLMSVLSLNMAYADYAHARIYRAFTDYFSRTYKSNHRIWFIGEYGLRHYMEEKGYSYLPFEDEHPTAGDIVVTPRLAALYGMSEELSARVHPLGSIGYEIKTPLRIFDYHLKAGYYSHGWGFLPFYFSRQETERFNIFRVLDPNFFIRNFKSAKIEAPPDNATIATYTINGDSRTGLYEHPPAKITYKFIVPERARLAFGIGIAPEAWDKEGDGVSFEVRISADGVPRSLFSKYIDPKHRPEDRTWHDTTIDLSDYEGTSVLLTFVTAPGPAEDATYDWALWGGLRLISGENELSDQR